ncbi:unnamed protein product [Polarella glacialis]|uniref:ADP,ATP carrier protein n=1 Tax=Polarella glacialis TaxID=89957 RepID=A0A813L124_POLGL|nr:unnamed protein product [Polarella glacialis]|mmetsp:Transcript_65078/g.105221  ORF Transcript_65078/g.105221 Transcript_65078/m.105221 type:complete len:343 (-) Transcript_65078:2-1030(-)
MTGALGKFASSSDSDSKSKKARDLTGSQKNTAELSLAFVAAASTTVGELLTTVLLYPIELVKTRLQTSISKTDGSGFAYTGLLDGLASVLREEGPQGLFTGILPVIVRAVCTDFASVFFGESLITRYGSRGDSANAMLALLLRTLGCWVSIALTLPLEAVATRVTTARRPISAAAAARALWREGGPAAFWRGLPVGLLLCLNPALMFTVMDRLKLVILSLRRGLPTSGDGVDQMSLMEASFAGAASKLLTMLLVYPMIRGKSLIQARDMGGAGILQVMLGLVREGGIQSLYQGIVAQLSKSVLSSSVKYAVKEQTEGKFRRMMSSAAAAPEEAEGDEAQKKV